MDFSARGLTLGPSQYATLVAISGEAPDYNRESVYNRIAGFFDYVDVEGRHREFRMGSAHGTPRPGTPFFGQTTHPPGLLADGSPDALWGNWMMQNVGHQGTVLYLDEGTIEIARIAEPAPLSLLAIAFVYLLRMRFGRGRRGSAT
jgi:hypothetical protein